LYLLGFEEHSAVAEAGRCRCWISRLRRADTRNEYSPAISAIFEWIDLRTVSGPVTVIALAGYAGTLVVASRMKRLPGRSPTPL